jgi:hypothetical protein
VCKKKENHDPSHAYAKLLHPLVTGEDVGIFPFQLGKKRNFREFSDWNKESWWGFKFTAVPEYAEENSKKILEENKDTIESILNQMNIAWDAEKVTMVTTFSYLIRISSY